MNAYTKYTKYGIQENLIQTDPRAFGCVKIFKKPLDKSKSVDLLPCKIK